MSQDCVRKVFIDHSFANPLSGNIVATSTLDVGLEQQLRTELYDAKRSRDEIQSELTRISASKTEVVLALERSSTTIRDLNRKIIMVADAKTQLNSKLTEAINSHESYRNNTDITIRSMSSEIQRQQREIGLLKAQLSTAGRVPVKTEPTAVVIKNEPVPVVIKSEPTSDNVWSVFYLCFVFTIK